MPRAAGLRLGPLNPCLSSGLRTKIELLIGRSDGVFIGGKVALTAVHAAVGAAVKGLPVLHSLAHGGVARAIPDVFERLLLEVPHDWASRHATRGDFAGD